MEAETRRKPRRYRQTARAVAAEATGERILDVFTSALQSSWFDEITLDEVARQSDVTVQTVIRRFGSKEGLLAAAQDRFGAEIRQRRTVPPGDAAKAVNAVIEDYEKVGDLIMRVLAQEEHYAPLRAVTDEGRAVHRDWVGANFAPWLDRLDEPERTAAHDALVVAMDLYVWKLIRRDMGRPKSALAALMKRMIAAALMLPEHQIFTQTCLETSNASR